MARAADVATAEVWRGRLERQARSGISIAEFCRRERLSPPSFYQWRKRLASTPPAARQPRFVPVQMAEAPRTIAGVEIELPSGAVVRLPAGASRELVTAAIEAAARAGKEEAPC